MDALQDVAGQSDNGSMPSSRGQSLNNEANTQSLPGLLRARANSIDVDEVERGSLLGRGCALGDLYYQAFTDEEATGHWKESLLRAEGIYIGMASVVTECPEKSS